MIIAIPTVYHTGTHLLKHQIFREKTLFAPRSGRSLVHWHVNRPVRHHGPDFMFSSIRHPARVAESFARRKVKMPGREHAEFIRQWKNLMAVYHKQILVYVHPDHHSRDLDVAKIAELTGLDLKCNWEIDKATSGAKFDTHEIPLSECPEVPEEFVDFYYETIQ